MHQNRTPRVPSPVFLFFGLVLIVASTERASAQIGVNYCTSQPNSAGAGARAAANGSADAAHNDVTLLCAGLPPQSLGYFLVSQNRGFLPNAGGSLGDLCLGAFIGRYSSAVLTASGAGDVALAIDLTAVPHPVQPISVVNGDTLHFQLWYRDVAPGGGAVSNWSDGVTVAFRPGLSFPSPILAVGDRPGLVELGDLDADGDLDIVCANLDGDSISVMIRHDDGSFAAHVEVPTGDRPIGTALGDLDGDGDVDIAVTNYNDSNFVVLVNEGNSVFTAGALHATPPNPASIEAGDFDGDGNLDLVVVQQDAVGSISVHLNRGDGTFVSPAVYGVGAYPHYVAIADYDGDGALDLAVTANLGGLVDVLLNAGGGGFAAPVSYDLGMRPSAIVAADFDGDGDVDLVTGNLQEASISLLRNDGGGSFVIGNEQAVPYNQGPHFLGAIDVDGDGDVDLMAGVTDGSFAELTNDGGGEFSGSVLIDLNILNFDIAFGDLEGDGHLDVVIPDWARDSVTVLEGRGPREFDLPHPVSGWRADVGIHACDLDGDGDLDAVSGGTNATLATLFNRGDGTFGVPVTYPVASPWGVAPTVGDVDGDGDIDVMVGSLSQSAVALYSNLGNGALVAGPVYPVGAAMHTLALGDVDGDGDLDLVVAHSNNSLSVHLNAGNGTFTPLATHAVGAQPVALELVDLDADGDLDIAVVERTAETLSVLLNQGGGAFGPAVIQAVTRRPSGIAAGDFDGDGAVDLVVSSDGWVVIAVFLNQGLGSFGVDIRLDTGRASYGVAALDMDGDGMLDVVQCGDGAALVVFHGLGGGQFAPIQASCTLVQGEAMGTGDLDMDGDIDVLIGSYNSAVMLNE